jgi:hypothetical protein
MSIIDLAKNLHNAGKAAGLHNLRVVRFAERGAVPKGGTRYDGTVRGDAILAENESGIELFFWMVSAHPQTLLHEGLQKLLDELQREIS